MGCAKEATKGRPQANNAAPLVLQLQALALVLALFLFFPYYRGEGRQTRNHHRGNYETKDTIHP